MLCRKTDAGADDRALSDGRTAENDGAFAHEHIVLDHDRDDPVETHAVPVVQHLDGAVVADEGAGGQAHPIADPGIGRVDDARGGQNRALTPR